MKSVLFVCVHNSARSQMAEAFLKEFGQGKFEVESAGIEPGKLNPLAIEVMKEVGIDISKNPTKDVFDLYKQGKNYLYVITVCDPKVAEKCPVFPGRSIKLQWSFDDPSSFTGTHDEQLEKTREVRDAIKEAVEQFIKESNEGKLNLF